MSVAVICDGYGCGSRGPVVPAGDGDIGDCFGEAVKAGWGLAEQALDGRDLCPTCLAGLRGESA